MMKATVSDIIDIMEDIAPSILAEEWDNVGLQVGNRNWLVKKIWVALDPLPEVVEAASKDNVDLLITHHPLIFRPISALDFGTPTGAVIQMATQHQLSIFCAHTNLDSAEGGVNDVLASRIGLNNVKVLGKPVEADKQFKLAVYVPVEYEEKILNALFETNAGKIGKYSCCSFRTKGKGTFLPSESAKPFLGKIGTVSHADETRIEAIVKKSELKRIIEHIRLCHPYETMAYDLYPLYVESSQGIGRIGDIEPTNFTAFVKQIKEKLNLKSVKITGKHDIIVCRVSVCSGSASGLMKDFFNSGAQVYVGGDFRYHDARDAQSRGTGLIDIGHFASEHLILDVLSSRLQKIATGKGLDVHVETCGIENDPFILE